jgi:hypothetical protein
MSTFRPARLLAAAAILAGIPLLSVSAQTPPPPSPTRRRRRDRTWVRYRKQQPPGLPIRPKTGHGTAPGRQVRYRPS